MLLEFVDGTPCDIDGKKRSTTVKILCGSSLSFVSISEDETCHYKLVIESPSLCVIPGDAIIFTLLSSRLAYDFILYDSILSRKGFMPPEEKTNILSITPVGETATNANMFKDNNQRTQIRMEDNRKNLRENRDPRLSNKQVPLQMAPSSEQVQTVLKYINEVKRKEKKENEMQKAKDQQFRYVGQPPVQM